MRAFLDQLGRIVVPKHQFADVEPVAELNQQLTQSNSNALKIPMAIIVVPGATNRCVANGQQIHVVVEYVDSF